MLKGIMEEATYYYHPDHLGSVSVVSNHRGEPYERVEYLPFGEVWIEDVDPATGYIPFRFTSKELDKESGLYYYGARYYEPKVSRWMSADPAGFALVNPNRGGYSVIEATNWYSYVSNNPVKYVDPTGEEQYNQQPTDAERKFARKHPFVAIGAKKNADIASMKVMGIEGEHKGKGDAMRHAYWSAMNARDFGGEKAKEIGDAHEDVSTQPTSEKEMDTWNNDVGIMIGTKNPDASDEELWNEVMRAWDAGLLKALEKPKQNEKKQIPPPQKPLLQ